MIAKDREERPLKAGCPSKDAILSLRSAMIDFRLDYECNLGRSKR